MAGSACIAARVVHHLLITRTQCRMLTFEKLGIGSVYESPDGDEGTNTLGSTSFLWDFTISTY